MEQTFSAQAPFAQMPWTLDRAHACWRREGIVTCAAAQAPALQCINIYVPESYLTPQGAVSADGRCGRYTVGTAPIVLENAIGGYSECEPFRLEDKRGQGIACLAAGMVYVSAGARGRQTKAPDGRYIGKAPAGLVDLKAAVRFLRHYGAVLPGSTERIVSVGVSAGGAMSALLGCTGNSENYTPMLRACGAFPEERDDVFAAQCYCPILDLDHADMAYEWMFDGVYRAAGMDGLCPGGALDAFRQALSRELRRAYIDYFNGLHLRRPDTGEALTLGADGRSGSGYRYLMEVLDAAAARYLRRQQTGEPLPHTARTRADALPAWLEWDGQTARVESLNALLNGYLERLKPCTAFDTLECTQAENQEFGDETHDFVHFDPYLPAALAAEEARFPAQAGRSLADFAGVAQEKALARRRYLLNPLSYLGTAEKAALAGHYRIRVGTHDPHTSFTMAMTLALKAQEAGCPDVDYAMVWDADHGPADYPGELLKWIDRITEENEPKSGRGAEAAELRSLT